MAVVNPDIGRVVDRIGDLALRMRARRILEALAVLPPGARVLDCGAGNAFYGQAARRLGLDVSYVAAEPDAAALRWAASVPHAPSALVAADGCRLPMPDACFDCVILSEVLEHVADPGVLLREVRRVLRGDGRLVVTVPSARYPFLWDPVNRTAETLARRPVRAGFWAGIWAGHLRLYTPDLLVEHLRLGGFEPERLETLTGYCLPFHHNLVHLGARLLYGGSLPEDIAASVDRFREDPDRRPVLVRAAFGATGWLERINERRPRRRAGVGLYAEATPAGARAAPGPPGDVRVVAMAAQGPGLSGGDRIFIELARRWSGRGGRVRIHAWEEGRDMCLRNGLPASMVEVWPARGLARRGRTRSYVGRTLLGVRHARRARGVGPGTVVSSASDFWPDAIPALVMKRRFGARWVAGFYMFAPPPHRGFEGAARRGPPRAEDVFYWLSQRVSLPLVRRWADVVLVTSEPERDRMRALGVDGARIVVVRGGVDLALADRTPPGAGPSYDAVFIGRLHVQKGVRQLLDVWAGVVEELPSARLAVIGDGPLDAELRRRAEGSGLRDYVDFLGFLDGPEKFAVFKRSKMVVHPALYDSGGMAACEAFACGIPGVSFDLPALRTYYPRGMLKVPCFDLDAFAHAIAGLLRDDSAREALGKEARSYAEEWDWERRASEIADGIARALAVAGRP